MRKNFFDPIAQNDLMGKITKLDKNATAEWGKMNVHEMLVHCSDALRVSLGTRSAERRDNLFLRTIAKKLILGNWMKFPKGRTRTFPEAAQDKAGTALKTFEEDKQELKNLLKEMLERGERGKFARHPMFGKMTGTDWGRLTFIHLKHHLKQFGVE